MDATARAGLRNASLVVAAPLHLAVLELFHPHAGNVLQLDVDRWLFVHYAQIPLFPLAAIAVAALLHGRRDLASIASRVALFVFAVSFIAFDTAAGLVVGLLVQAAHASGDAPAWRDAIDVIWRHPVVGGVRDGGTPSLSSIGALALGLATLTAAISLRRAGRPWPPVLLLAISGWGLEVFNTHAWPGGPLTFGGIAVAAGWLQWSAARDAARRDSPVILQPRARLDRRSNWRPHDAHAAHARPGPERRPGSVSLRDRLP
ncbi:hypothetical protein [Cognatiluteimonas telluris]|uniref:hypothetical protein n=1 Tax=Cognatiluteimonas telluris TaxID=1104775 RepID=UPI00140C2C2D|nr:hypothetical protein [Lysobacter telluris]